MITLNTIIYEGNFNNFLKEDNWFFTFKSKYINYLKIFFLLPRYFYSILAVFLLELVLRKTVLSDKAYKIAQNISLFVTP
jgi:hypothetical protein